MNLCFRLASNAQLAEVGKRQAEKKLMDDRSSVMRWLMETTNGSHRCVFDMDGSARDEEIASNPHHKTLTI